MCIACSPLAAAFAPAATRRHVLGTGARLASGAALAGFGGLFRCAEAQVPATGPGPAELIFSGGPILTMNDAQPAAEAVAVRGGRILAVGTRAEIEAHAGPATRRVDLAGRTMLPGFFDAHGHALICGLQALTANLLPAPDGPGDDIPALVRTLREWAAANAQAVQRYQLIFGFGYDESQLREQRVPTRDDLDQVSTELPVVILHTSSHILVANSKALELARVTADTPDPEGGWFLRREGSREPNGVAQELAMAPLLGLLFSRFDRDAWLAMARAGAEAYASFGYTTCQEGRALPGATENILAAAERGLLAIDFIAYPDIVAARDAIRAPLLRRTYQNRFRVGGAKLTLDGSPQGKTAWLTRPYHVAPPGQRGDFAGQPTISSEGAFREVDRAFTEGWQLLCHCNGDAAIDLMIAAARAAVAKHGAADRRMVLIHGQTLREDQVDAIRELGIIPSLFPMHTFYWGDWHRDSVLGPERAENISPTGWCLARGMRFTTHHDAPVARPDSMRVLSATVTRRSRSGDIIGPRHRVPVATALKAMTLWAAWQHFEDDQKGSIEAGKLADFVLLSDNPLTVDPERLSELKVSQTIKEGVAVYTA
jgi:predicted amidohydrolase YtcJ